MKNHFIPLRNDSSDPYERGLRRKMVLKNLNAPPRQEEKG